MVQDTAHISDAFLETDEESAAAIPENLREVSPIPPAADTEKLEDEASRHRVLFVRGGAVIAVTTLISIGGALFLHAALAGVVVLGTWFPHTPAPRGGGSPGGASAPDALPMLVHNAVEDPHPIALAAPPAGVSAPALPALQPLPEIAAVQMIAPQPAPALLPTTTENFGTVRIAPPKPLASAATPTNGAAFSPGSDGEAFSDEPVVNYLKPGAGKGRGTGSGTGRGISAADRQPQLLLLGDGPGSNFSLPLKYQLKPPENSVKLIIAVAADGSIAAIKLEQSCGIPDLDELVRAYARANLHFSPAYKAGKAVTADYPFELSFKPFD